MHFLPENRMCAPPFATKQRPPHLENPGSATVFELPNMHIDVYLDLKMCKDREKHDLFNICCFMADLYTDLRILPLIENCEICSLKHDSTHHRSI